MSRKRKTKEEKVILTECEDCGAYPAIWRWFNGKVLCSECATKAFAKYLGALVLGVAIVIGLCLSKNTNMKKQSNNIEHVIISIYLANNKPYASQVKSILNDFIKGKSDIIDFSTGHKFSLSYFTDNNIKPSDISEATIWNILNDPKNRMFLSKEVGFSNANSMKESECIECVCEP